jgi:hypothetical protein
MVGSPLGDIAIRIRECDDEVDRKKSLLKKARENLEQSSEVIRMSKAALEELKLRRSTEPTAVSSTLKPIR